MNMKFLDEAWTEGEKPEVHIRGYEPVLDKEYHPTSVRNSRAVPKPRTVSLETEDNARATG
ncbi:hypothetical protein BDM02DRAFT_3110182 [Thelephora ganbajun]|uniref:Uncharacterized protein n=1 Tax=Thelephora ganbajun TaxID=370292 RepID=A0ACB6ZQD0_THEGA|nr:hypothetical protein BDM02DRAFT_3110182 [Thelephora ganbajun]